jgi:hypothetical protein
MGVMPQIWDCVPFGRDVDLLEHRLRELDGVVDRFVICEATSTFAGTPKPLVFDESRERFAPWRDRVVHVVTDLAADAPSAWHRAEQQRRALGAAVREHVRRDDFVLVSDVDELVDRDVLRTLVRHYSGPVRLGMPHAIYFANWWLPVQWPDGPMLVGGSELDEPVMRTLLGDPHDEWDGYHQVIVGDCGVHVSYTGGIDTVLEKFGTLANEELRTGRPERAHVRRLLDLGIHFEGRYVLDRRAESALPPVLRRLYGRAPELFDFGAPPATAQARAYCGYTWVRYRGRIPRGIRRGFDARPDLVTGAAGPLFRGLHAGLEARRRRHPVAEQRHLDPIQLDLAELVRRCEALPIPA